LGTVPNFLRSEKNSSVSWKFQFKARIFSCIRSSTRKLFGYSSVLISYSYRRESTGLAVAARMICQLIVKRDRTKITIPTRTNIHQPIAIR
jgi:hypothetical protein